MQYAKPDPRRIAIPIDQLYGHRGASYALGDKTVHFP